MVVPYNSVPLVFKNVVVVGANNPPPPASAPGNARAFDARTGAKLWEFSSVAQPGTSRPRHVGRRQLEESRRRQRVAVLLHARRAARPRLPAARLADPRLVRRRSQGRESVRQFGRRGGPPDRRLQVALPDDPSRHLGRTIHRRRRASSTSRATDAGSRRSR